MHHTQAAWACSLLLLEARWRFAKWRKASAHERLSVAFVNHTVTVKTLQQNSDLVISADGVERIGAADEKAVSWLVERFHYADEVVAELLQAKKTNLN